MPQPDRPLNRQERRLAVKEQARELARLQNQAAIQPATVPTIADLFEQQSPGSLQKLPKELQGIVQTMRIEASYSHSGPLPPAWELAEYCKYIPDAGNRMMTMAENQSAHRISLEAKIAPRQVEESGRGQKMAFGLASLALLVTAWLGYLHETTAACTVGGATVISLATAFLGGKAAILKNLASKKPTPTAVPSAPGQRSKPSSTLT